MPKIQNVALSDIKKGNHMPVDETAILIQIVDPLMEFPVAKHTFKEVYQFEFLDLEQNDNYADDFKISDAQASELVDILQKALLDNSDVIVHCVAGVCRSGAVCEVGVIMGFDDTNSYRSPNLMVKHKMMKKLGLTYDSDETHTINGIMLDSGIIVPKNYEGDI
jgi:predicted protein tyrosine phosphatase